MVNIFHFICTATEVRNTYLQAMKEIEEDTKVHGKTCVKFVPKTSQHHDYIYILPQTGWVKKDINPLKKMDNTS